MEINRILNRVPVDQFMKLFDYNTGELLYSGTVGEYIFYGYKPKFRNKVFVKVKALEKKMLAFYVIEKETKK